MTYFLTDNNSTKSRYKHQHHYWHSQDQGKNICQHPCFQLHKHITFNKGEYVGHLEPTLIHNTTIDQSEAHSTKSITLQKLMVEQVKPNIFDPPHHKLKTSMQRKLDTLLVEFETQFAKDETSIGTTPLTNMTINTGNSDSVSQKPYPIAMKN